MQPSRVIRVGSVDLAFGLEWLPLLGDAGQASAMARRQGASHRILSGNPPAALGMSAGLSRRHPCWSAAALMAQLHPTGTVAWVVRLDADSWHVLACHEGVALARADRSYPDRDLACEAVDALRLSYPHLDFQSGSASAAESEEVRLRELASATGSYAALQPVRRLWRRALWAVGSLVLLAVAVLRFWWSYPVAQDPQRVAQAAWMQVFEEALARQPVHGTQGTRDLLAALYDQPVHLAGWRLRSVRCEPSAGLGPWQCQSEYRRALTGADNRGFMEAAQAGWHLDFPSLDRVRVRWPLVLAAQRPDPQQLPVGQVQARDWASTLQEILPAFSRLQVEPARALALVAPRDSQGQELARPLDLPALATRALRVQGPLQSASLLVPLAQPVSWQKMVLDVAPAARAGLRTGRLILHLEGIVYERA